MKLFQKTTVVEMISNLKVTRPIALAVQSCLFWDALFPGGGMRKVILFSAISIDGFIAKSDGNLDWLYAFDSSSDEIQKETSQIFFDFYKTIDTTLIGNTTYRQMIANGDATPFGDKENFVFTHDSELEDTNNAKYIHDDIEALVAGIKAIDKKDIWLVGGGILNAFFLKKALIDEMILAVKPIILGAGIKLFEKCTDVVPTGFDLVDVTKYLSGSVNLHYRRRNDV